MKDTLFKDFVAAYQEKGEIVYFTLKDGTSYNCKVKEVYADFIRITLCSFNKATQVFEDTVNEYFIPFAAIVTVRA